MSLTSLSSPSHLGTAKWLWSIIRPHRLGFILSTLAFVLASFTEPLVPALLSHALNTIAAQSSGQSPSIGSGVAGAIQSIGLPSSTSLDQISPWIIPVALVLVFMVRGILLFLGAYLLQWAASRTVFDLRTLLMEAIIKANAALYTDLNPGIAITRVVNHPQTVLSLLGGATTTLLRDGTTAAAMLAYLFYLDWKLTLVAFIVLPFMAQSIRMIHGRSQETGRTAFEAEMKLVSCVDDIARAWRVVRTFDAGNWELDRFKQAGRHLQRAFLKSAAASSLMSPVSQLIASTGLALILGMAVWQAQERGSTPGDFAAFVLAMLSLLSSVRRLTDISQPIIGGLLTAQGCRDLIQTPAEPDAGTLSIESCHGRIEVDNLAITYPNTDTPAINGLSISVSSGQTIALVGASGSGKSTLVSALLGFVEPQKGRITLDDLNIQDLRKASLRKQFAVVSQDIVLFEGSMADNVAYAQPRDPVKLEHCLKAANLWDFISSQPEGWDMLIGTNGSKLSGGQRQRLAIARALYKGAPVWIFDEATSALDTESERAVQQAIEEWHGRKTLILIAHRLSTVVNADRIYVISAGRVIESGTHSELLNQKGAYSAMVMAQAAI